jgi:hypothetical protein
MTTLSLDFFVEKSSAVIRPSRFTMETACRLCSGSGMGIMSVLGCQILTLEAPLVAGKAPWMLYNGYTVYIKDDVRSPFVKPPWIRLVIIGKHRLMY